MHSQPSLDAFNDLCTKCDKVALNLYLGMLLDASFNRLDRWESATDGLDREALRSMSRRASELIREIERLRKSPFVAALAYRQKIRRPDLLHPLNSLDEPFQGLLQLDELAADMGPRLRPNFTRTLEELIAYVRERFQRPKYAELELVLDALKIPATNLKQWSYDHTRRQVRRKSK